jgi:molybdopterin-guanine dinucleotide biosynthesis protein A
MGKNKALMKVDGKPMARLVADVLKEVCNEVAIVGGNKEEHSTLGFPWFPDSVRDCGPLGGIYTALTLFENDVVVCACDLPNITPDLVQFLLFHDASAGSSATVLCSGTMIQPLLGVYHQSCLPLLRHFLEDGGRKVLDFLH